LTDRETIRPLSTIGSYLSSHFSESMGRSAAQARKHEEARS
jgi:hypothetical protein